MVNLIQNFNLNGLNFDLGSDWHWDLDSKEILGKVIDHIVRNQRSRVLILAGDVFETASGRDSSEAINELIGGVANHYPKVIFTPGNHDLRGREKPWDSFQFPDNVICPYEASPLIHTIDQTRILVANLFYEIKFTDPSIFGLNTEQIIEQYRQSNDGKYFINGDIGLFEEMKKAAVKSLDETIDITVSHALPHPSLVVFRVDEMTEEMKKLSREEGLVFICKPAEDEEMAKKMKLTPKEFRRDWNSHSSYMGSNIVKASKDKIKDGHIFVHGHNHRSGMRSQVLNGKVVNFVAHQPNIRSADFRF